MRALLIDPTTQTISEVDYSGDFHHIYELLDCSTFDVVSIDPAHDIYVDDEGLLKQPSMFFEYKGYQTPLAGKGLVLCHDDEGNSTAATMSLDELKSQVVFFLHIGMGVLVEVPYGDAETQQ